MPSCERSAALTFASSVGPRRTLPVAASASTQCWAGGYVSFGLGGCGVYVTASTLEPSRPAKANVRMDPPMSIGLPIWVSLVASSHRTFPARSDTTILWPSAEYWSPERCAAATVRRCTSRPLASHTLTTPSPPVVANLRPSGDQSHAPYSPWPVSMRLETFPPAMGTIRR